MAKGAPRLKWFPFIVDGAPSLAVKAATEDASGAYAIRTKRGRGVVYVGESHVGRLWRTLNRHMHAPGSFTDPGPKGGHSSFATDHPEDYEVAWKVTTRGKREKKNGDQRAMTLQARWIAAFRAAGHRLKNRDDGLAAADEGDDSFEFGANVEPAGAFDGLINPPGAVLDPVSLLGSPSGKLSYVKSSSPYESGTLRDGRGEYAKFNATKEDEAPLSKWAVAATEALRKFRGTEAGRHIPSPETEASSDVARFWVALARALPKTPAVDEFRNLPWSLAPSRRGAADVWDTPEGATVLSARDSGIAAQLALLANLSRMGETLRKVPSGASSYDVRELMRKRERTLENTEARWGKGREESDRKKQYVLALELQALQLAYEALGSGMPAPAPVLASPDAVASAVVAHGRFATVKQIRDAGFSDASILAAEKAGVVNLKIGNDPKLRNDADCIRIGRDVYQFVVSTAPAPAPRPAGYGEADAKRAGQLRMFNPSKLVDVAGRSARPSGVLTALGLLTRLDLERGGSLSWSLRDAPVLAYDGNKRLWICYRDGRVVRSSSAAELREYRRTHWGRGGEGAAMPAGKVRDCGFAVGPFVVIGPSSSVTYTTKKGGVSELIDWVHPWGEGASRKGFEPPILLEHACRGGCGAKCAARGSLRLAGGTYRVTDRGIVG